MTLDDPANSAQLARAKAAAPLKTDGVEPELRRLGFGFHVDVRRFMSIARVEEESVWPGAKNGRHDVGERSEKDEMGTLPVIVSPTIQSCVNGTASCHRRVRCTDHAQIVLGQ